MAARSSSAREATSGRPSTSPPAFATHATAGQILCTESIATAAAHLEGVSFRGLGPVTLKNILAPVRIFEVVVAGRRNEGTDLIDPVCQMRVDPVTTAAQLSHGGRTYHFCSPECTRTFATRVEGSGGPTWT